MLVHSGAALHGHEFSNEQTDKSWMMNPLSYLSNMINSEFIRSLHTALPGFDDEAPPPSRSASVKETGRGQHTSFTTRRHTTSDLANVVKAQGLLSDARSDDVASISGSERTDGSVRLNRRKRKARSSVRYALAFPAPGLRTKQRSFFQVRPRVLLQLRELAGANRAIPAFDVVPSSVLAGTLIIPALVKAFPRMFKAKPHLGQNDFLLVQRDDYVPAHGTQHDGNQPGDSSNTSDYREVLAVISTTEDDDCAKIVFKDGSTWVTSRNAGSYEFNHTNEQGETVRAKWIKKPSLSPRTSWGSANSAFDASSPPSSPTTPTPESKWTFCILDPSTKKHPIQGILDSTSLEIYDTYATMPASSGQLPSIAQAIEEEVTGISEDSTSIAEERSSMEVSEYNKTLMLATATWISLRQSGWPASVTPKASRAVSQCINSGRSQAGSPEGTNPGASNSQVSLTDGINSTEDPSTTTQAPATGRLRRALSSGGEFMKRRREAAAAAAALALIAEQKADEKHVGDLKVREEPAKCRTRVKRLAHKVFHHSSTQRVS